MTLVECSFGETLTGIELLNILATKKSIFHYRTTSNRTSEKGVLHLKLEFAAIESSKFTYGMIIGMNGDTFDSADMVWKGKPTFVSYMAGVIPYVIFGFLAGYLFLRVTTEENFLALSPVLILFVWLIVVLPIRRYLMWSQIEYYINSREVVIRCGVFKPKYIKIMMVDIQKVDMFKNFVDDLAGQKSRTIYLYTTLTGTYSEFGGNFESLTPHDSRSSVHGYYSLKSVPNGEEVIAILDNFWKQGDHKYPLI